MLTKLADNLTGGVELGDVSLPLTWATPLSKMILFSSIQVSLSLLVIACFICSKILLFVLLSISPVQFFCFPFEIFYLAYHLACLLVAEFDFLKSHLFSLFHLLLAALLCVISPHQLLFTLDVD